MNHDTKFNENIKTPAVTLTDTPFCAVSGICFKYPFPDTFVSISLGTNSQARGIRPNEYYWHRLGLLGVVSSNTSGEFDVALVLQY